MPIKIASNRACETVSTILDTNLTKVDGTWKVFVAGRLVDPGLELENGLLAEFCDKLQNRVMRGMVPKNVLELLNRTLLV